MKLKNIKLPSWNYTRIAMLDTMGLFWSDLTLCNIGKYGLLQNIGKRDFLFMGGRHQLLWNNSFWFSKKSLEVQLESSRTSTMVLFYETV